MYMYIEIDTHTHRIHGILSWSSSNFMAAWDNSKMLRFAASASMELSVRELSERKALIDVG